MPSLLFVIILCYVNRFTIPLWDLTFYKKKVVRIFKCNNINHILFPRKIFICLSLVYLERNPGFSLTYNLITQQQVSPLQGT